MSLSVTAEMFQRMERSVEGSFRERETWKSLMGQAGSEPRGSPLLAPIGSEPLPILSDEPPRSYYHRPASGGAWAMMIPFFPRIA